MRLMNSSLNEGSEIRGCKEWWGKKSVNSSSNQTYPRLQRNSQKTKPNHHWDHSNHSLPQHRLSPRGGSRPPGICNQSGPKGAFSTCHKPGASRSQAEGRWAWLGHGQSRGVEAEAFSAREPQP